MITTTLSQPEIQLGNEFTSLLTSDGLFSRIIFVSAFTALKTILRLRESMLAAAEAGAVVRLIVGIDLGGTSKEVLEELSQWDCEVFVYHNPIPRATFHPKIYLFEQAINSTLFLGSNNLTDGGLYTNYEAATRYFFEFPDDCHEYERILQPIRTFIEPTGPTVRRLDKALIEILSARGNLLTEIEARRNRRQTGKKPPGDDLLQSPNPFSPMNVPLPPLLPTDVRKKLSSGLSIEEQQEQIVPPSGSPRPEGLLVWRKVLTRTDALQARPGSHHVGGVRLTQARFENHPGHRIDQTTYFRGLFDEFDWEAEPGGHADQEHVFIPMRVIIRGTDFGIRNFEISHKPSGEAGQANYTTILRWGRSFVKIVEEENLTAAVFSLYETPDSDAPYLIEITDL